MPAELLPTAAFTTLSLILSVPLSVLLLSVLFAGAVLFNTSITNVEFVGGCPGNLKAISKLLEGAKAKEVASLLAGNTCGPRPTSCADQLSKALNEALVANNLA